MGRAPISKEEVIESFIRSSGPGGQNVNKVSSCVQLLHVPTKITVKCQKYRTQAQNREEAWELLEKAVEAKYEREYRALIDRREKKRRQNRKPSKSAKERNLADKKKHSLKKQVRRVSSDE